MPALPILFTPAEPVTNYLHSIYYSPNVRVRIFWMETRTNLCMRCGRFHQCITNQPAAHVDPERHCVVMLLFPVLGKHSFFFFFPRVFLPGIMRWLVYIQTNKQTYLWSTTYISYIWLATLASFSSDVRPSVSHRLLHSRTINKYKRLNNTLSD